MSGKVSGQLVSELAVRLARTLIICVNGKTLYLGQGNFWPGTTTVETFRHLTSGLAVAAQLQPADMARAAADGFTKVVNNRPDDEEAGQPHSSVMRDAAEAAGLEYEYLPVIAGNLTDDNVLEFDQLLRASNGPVLMFCRSGTRCTHLWALQQAWTRQQPLECIVAAAAQAGYDIQALIPRMHRR